MSKAPTRWGVIRYAACSGSAPEEDAAAFDGWYDIRDWALAVAKDWHKRYPRWVVALVEEDTAWFGDDSGPGDFSKARDIPLTEREKAFKMINS